MENKDMDSANFLKTFDQEKLTKKEQEIIFINDSTIAKVYRSLLKQIKELSTFNKD